MLVGNRLRTLREHQKLSQGDIERRTGLLRCYVSRVENGHTVPAVETLEKWARALNLPLYELLYDGETPPKLVVKNREEEAWGSSRKDSRFVNKLREHLGRMSEKDRTLLYGFCQLLAKQKHQRPVARDAQ